MLALAILALPAHAVDLAAVGVCPGEVLISIDGATPGASYALFSADGPGDVAVPRGTCAGTVSGVSAEGLRLRVLADADGAGTARFRPTLGVGACGIALQALDMVSCTLSDVVYIGDDVPGERILYAADGRAGAFDSNLYKIDLDLGTARSVAPLERPYTGLSFAPDGTLYGVTGAGGALAEVHTLDLRSGEAVPVHVSGYGSWSGMTWNFADRNLYAWTEGGDTLLEVDLVTGAERAIYSSSSYGHCMAADEDGFMVRVAANVAYAIDPVAGTEETLGEIAGLPAGARGQGCAFRDGLLYIAPSTDGVTRSLYEVDLDTLRASDTGIAMPQGLDAIGSRAR
ncbi:MAG: hypothetical protein ACI8PZ_006283 [Myxococcota bacterium]|jgi:hypothetical protein